MTRLGLLLVRADLVSENNLARALGIQNFAGGRLGTLLLERGSIDEDSLGKTLALQHGCEYVPWRVLADVSPVVIAALPAKFAIKHAAIPYERGENYLRLALRDPGDLRILDELFFVTGRKIVAGVAPEVRIYQALEKYYGERRTPRYAILAEKLSRPVRPSRSTANAPPPPPDFFPSPPRKPAPGPQEVWGDAPDADPAEPPIIQSWKMPDQVIGGWAGTVSPGFDVSPPQEPETISWEEMPAIPSLWMPEPVAPAPASPSAPPVVETKRPPKPAPSRADARVSTGAAPPSPSAAPSAPFQPPPPREIDLPAPQERPLSAPARRPLQSPASSASGGVPAAPGPLATAPPAPAFESEGASVAGAPALAPPPPPVPEFPGPPPAAGASTVKPASVPAQPPPPSPAPPASVSTTPSATDFPEVAGATDRDSIAAAALAALQRRFLRGAIFVAKPDVVVAWGGCGKGVSPEELRDIAIPWTEPSVFLNARLSRAIYLGRLPPLPRHEAIAIAMGGWPEECLLQPILIKEKPVAFLYAEFTRDQGATPMDLAYMRELAAAASSAFVAAIRLKKKEI